MYSVGGLKFTCAMHCRSEHNESLQSLYHSKVDASDNVSGPSSRNVMLRQQSKIYGTLK